MAIFDFGGTASLDLHVLTLDDARRVEPLVVTEFVENNGRVSPDGQRFLIFKADVTADPVAESKGWR